MSIRLTIMTLPKEVAEVSAGLPTMVLIAPPNSAGMAVLGDGTFKERGRYAVVCFIPTGADPQAYLVAA